MRTEQLRRQARAGAAALVLLLSLGACGEPRARAERPLVVVSVLPMSFFVEKLAGDLVRVEVMIPPGASPATHEPTIRQLEAVSAAVLYVKVGHPNFPFERAWLDALLAETRGLAVVDASAGLEREAGDPHLWVSPRHARVMAGNLKAALARLFPEHEATLRVNHERLLAEIDAVDAEIRDTLGDKRGGSFLVFHPAWGHFAEEYGLVQVAIEQRGKEPDAKQLARLIEQAKAARFEVVFAQPHFDSAGAEVIAGEIGARVELLDPLAYEWSDNLREVARILAEAVRR